MGPWPKSIAICSNGNYGQYEGLTTAQIHAVRPDWQLFRDGCPGGESPEQVGARADAMLDRVRPVESECAAFFERPFPAGVRGPLAGAGAAGGRFLLLSTASLSALGYENNLSEPVIRLWNDTRHVKAANLRGTDVQA